MANKRQQKRYAGRCDVEFTTDNVTFVGTSSDFSLNGFFIRTNHPYTPGTLFDIVIHLPDGLISRVKGKAVRAGWLREVRSGGAGRVMGTPVKVLKNGMGIEIVEKDANYLNLIRSML